MLQNPNLKEYIRKSYFYDCAIEEDILYFPMANYNALCKADIKTGLAEIIDVFPNEENIPLLHCGIYKEGNQLLISTYKGINRLLSYDLEQRKFEVIRTNGIEKAWLNFCGNKIVRYEKMLYVFANKPVVLKINLNKHMAECFEYPDVSPDDDITGQILHLGDQVYIPCKNRNAVYIFDLKSESFQKLCFPMDIGGIATIEFDGTDFWVTGKDRALYSWNKENGLVIPFHDFPTGFHKIYNIEDSWFSDSIYFENNLYLIPAYANMIVRFDIKNQTMHEMHIPDEEENEETLNRKGRFFYVKYNMAKRMKDRILLLSSKTKLIYILNLRTQEIETINLKMKQDMWYQKKILEMGIIQEEYFTNGLEDFLRAIM